MVPSQTNTDFVKPLPIFLDFFFGGGGLAVFVVEISTFRKIFQKKFGEF
jgi:hypothetical protein